MRTAVFFLSIMVVTLCWGCDRDDLPFYAGGKTLVISHSEVLSFSFVALQSLADTGDATIGLPLLLVGMDSADRSVPYTMRVVSEDLRPMGYVGTSVSIAREFAGVRRYDTVYFDLKRDSMFMDSVYTVSFTLETAPVYNTPIKEMEVFGYVRHVKLQVDDQYKVPTWWTALVPYMGHFSSRKMRVLIQATDLHELSTVDVYNAMGTSWMVLEPLEFAIAFKQYLDYYESLGRPFLELNGEPMRVGDMVYDYVN